MRLGFTAIAVALVISVGSGVYAALRRDGAVDFVIMGIAMTGIAVPNFVMAPLLSLVFGRCLSLRLLPLRTTDHLCRAPDAWLAFQLHLAPQHALRVFAKGLPSAVTPSRGRFCRWFRNLGPATAEIMTSSVVVVKSVFVMFPGSAHISSGLRLTMAVHS